MGEVDGEPVIITLHRDTDQWTPRSVIRLEVKDHRIARIADYAHCPWILPTVTALVTEPPAPVQ